MSSSTGKHTETELNPGKTFSLDDPYRPHTIRVSDCGSESFAIYKRHREDSASGSFVYTGVTLDDGRLLVVPDRFPFPPNSSTPRLVKEFLNDFIDALKLLRFLPGYWGDGRDLLKHLYNLGEYLTDVIEAVEGHLGNELGDLSRQRERFTSAVGCLPNRF